MVAGGLEVHDATIGFRDLARRLYSTSWDRFSRIVE